MAAEKIIAIVGPTASGKSELAMKIAKRFDGEIICADSRTVYKDMDIGTAKPSAKDRAEIPHHLLDVAVPGQTFTAADFKRLAEKAIKDIHTRKKLPIIVGGSGLYISVLLYDYQLHPPADAAFRAQLERLTTPQLIEKLANIDPEAAAAIDVKNRRRLVRAIETAGLPKVRLTTLRPNCLLVGLKLNKETLRGRIAQRADKMIAQGLVDEVRFLGEKYGYSSEAMTSVAYRVFRPVAAGENTLSDAKLEFIKGDLALAKKQLTWFKHDPNVNWVQNQDEAVKLTDKFLS